MPAKEQCQQPGYLATHVRHVDHDEKHAEQHGQDVMKLYVTSDIHLEFGDCLITNEHDVDVLILGGDILVAADIGSPDASNFKQEARGKRIRDFLHQVSSQFPHTVMIMGNHEHYHGDFSKSYQRISELLTREELDNIYLLEKQTKIIDDYMFIGGTLWTSFYDADPLVMQQAQHGMSDFRIVKYSAKGHAGGIWKFIPQDAFEDHVRMLAYVQDVIDQRRAAGDRSDRVIVVGHHAPSRHSVHEKYRDDYFMNGSYFTDLEQFILDRSEICLWTHGHTHEDFDYAIGTTRVICNPRGYIGHEARADTWKPRLVEL